MFRVAASTVVRRTAQQSSSRGLPGAAFAPRLEFHASTRQEQDAAAAAATTETEEAPPSSWDTLYSIPIGIAFAVPAINYEWYLVNEETQLAACFIAFTSIVYKQFGGAIHDMLAQDGKRILAEHNVLEDQIITDLEDKLLDLKLQEHVVQDAHAIKALRLATFEKLNAAGVIKPQFEFKAQMEKMLHMMAAEEANMKEKSKQELMAAATTAVTAEFATSDSLKKTSLASAISQLQGKSGQDPVKTAYLQFFKANAVVAAKIDEVAELQDARASMIQKLNAVASNEGFFFEFDAATGKPKMTV